MSKTHYSILAIVMVMTIGIAVATPNAFALTQSSGEGASQSTSQSQGGLSLFSPQITIQDSDQSTNQIGCAILNNVCG